MTHPAVLIAAPLCIVSSVAAGVMLVEALLAESVLYAVSGGAAFVVAVWSGDWTARHS